MAAKSLFLSFLFLFLILGLTSSSAPSIEQQCSEEIAKVMPCLDYSTGKAAKPSESCCSSTKDIRKEDPVCLCYVIQQTYEGLPTLKQLGIKVEKLLQLPTDCNLVNSSASDCPKLLKLPPNSPEYAIFTNSSTVNLNSSNQTSISNDSNGSRPKAQYGTMAIMAMVFFSMFYIRPWTM